MSNEFDAPCISVRRPGDAGGTFSLSEYEAAVAYGETLGSPAARDRAGVGWTRFAPAVEEIRDSPAGQFGAPSFGVVDLEAYHAQMRRLLGLD